MGSVDKDQELVLARIRFWKQMLESISSMISMLEIYKSNRVKQILDEYRYALYHFLEYSLHSTEKGELDKTERHIQKAYKFAMENLILETYSIFENNYSRLRRISLVTGGAKRALIAIRKQMEEKKIRARIHELFKKDDFEEYLNDAGNVQIDFLDLTHQLSEAVAEYERFDWKKRGVVVYRTLMVILASILGVFLASKIKW